MRGKKANIHKSMLKERNKSTAPPPATVSTPSPGGSLFSGLTQIIGQGMAFGAGSSIGHRVIDGATELWSSRKVTNAQQEAPKVSKDHAFNECDDLKREFVACMQNNDHCNEVQSQYLGCLDKLKDN